MWAVKWVDIVHSKGPTYLRNLCCGRNCCYPSADSYKERTNNSVNTLRYLKEIRFLRKQFDFDSCEMVEINCWQLAYLLVYLPSHTLCPYFRLMCSVIKFINNDYSKLRITLRISVVMVMVAAAAAATVLVVAVSSICSSSSSNNSK